MSSIWRREGSDWRALRPSGFPNEAALHDLVEEAPHLLPLSGDPTLVVVGREVALGSGFADLVAVEPDGRVAIIEIKLRSNAEARRAVIAQILMYAAFLKGTDARTLEEHVLRTHLLQRPFNTLTEAAEEADQTGSFNREDFAESLTASLATGAFRLVLVLDEAPTELVQLVGYLESVSAGIVLDLVTVSAYVVGTEQILVPQRVDPEHVVEPPAGVAMATKPSRRKLEGVDGSTPFEASIERTSGRVEAELRGLLAWAQSLETRGLATLKSVLGTTRDVLLVYLPGDKAGLVSIWNDNGAYISLWRSVFARAAWTYIAPIEAVTGKPMGQGSTVRSPSQELLDIVEQAYETATTDQPEWDGKTYYVAFGAGPERSWEDAVEYGFVSGGGGDWYSKTLKQLQPGNEVYVYIPKGSGAGGYVGYGEVTGPAQLATDFVVTKDDVSQPLTSVARVDMTQNGTTDPEVAEWVVPVTWRRTFAAADAVKDSAFFANQNTATRLRDAYTLGRLAEAFM